ncbi:hypothetical protein [Acinetobacter brisouii]|uniref:hypothetical protein n=1 Tax=Acinetobacter brisouii TaxID=396323 RepID=UPI00124F6647|nr:hypothetical protein [Acinetobacter brisouii]
MRNNAQIKISTHSRLLLSDESKLIEILVIGVKDSDSTFVKMKRAVVLTREIVADLVCGNHGAATFTSKDWTYREAPKLEMDIEFSGVVKLSNEFVGSEVVKNINGTRDGNAIKRYAKNLCVGKFYDPALTILTTQYQDDTLKIEQDLIKVVGKQMAATVLGLLQIGMPVAAKPKDEYQASPYTNCEGWW